MEDQKEIKPKKPIYKRWWFVLVTIIIFVSIFSGDDEETKATTATAVNTEQTDTKPTPKENLKLILEFEKQLNDTENYARPALENYEQVMGEFEVGKLGIDEALDSASKAKDAADVMYTMLREVEISDKLPQDVRGLLDEGKEAIRAAYFLKKEALESMMDFLTNDNQNAQQEADKNFQQAQDYMQKGSEKILQAKEKAKTSQ